MATRKQKTADAIEAIRLRVLDVYTGAYGGSYDPDIGSICMSGNGEQFERFLRALAEVFPCKKVESTRLSWTFAHWNIAQFDTPESAAQWLLDAGEEIAAEQARTA